MAEPTKSAVFVDYESLQRSMNAGQGDMRLADRAVAWVAAIEAGRLVGLEPGRRRLVVKRCYAGANVRGKQRDALSAAGFEVIDSNPGDGSRSSADLHLAMDIIDALSQPNGAHEFILLASGLELAPLLSRLKASKRQTVIFADRATPVGDKALADSIIDAAEFQAFLASDEMPAIEAANAGSASDRAEIEAFARRIHGATNIPLFSPKTFAELFKHLADEIRENGYHFQTTAKNVADQMTATGRSVTRRQVVFIVKGLALKGHVFSNDDSPDDLAEVFREQARYLITNAGITLDQRQDQLLSAWFVSRSQAAPSPPAPRPQQPSANGATAPNGAYTEARRATPPATEKPAPPRAAPTPPAPPPVAVKPVAPPVKPVELPKSTAKPTPPPPIRLAPSPAAREEAKAIIAARIAASAKLKPSKAAAPAKPGAKSGPATAGKSQPPRRGSDVTSDALESSILAAIAEAVDVLVDSGAEDEMIVPEPQGKRRANPPRGTDPEPEPEHDIELEAEPASPEPQPTPADDAVPEGESGDIGDQIQRIIASYNRNRSDD